MRLPASYANGYVRLAPIRYFNPKRESCRVIDN